MIALNKLVKDCELYNKKYQLMGKRVNLDPILSLEKKFTKIQLEANSKRSICNKLCSQVAELTNSHSDTFSIIKQINHLDKNIIFLNKKADVLYKKINKKLKKLPNLATNLNITDIQVSTTKTKFQIANFNEFINNITHAESYQTPIKKYLAKHKNFIYDESSLPVIVFYKNKVSIFATETLINKIYNEILSTLKLNAHELIQKSIKAMNSESSEEYYAILHDKTIIKLNLIGEYFTRLYSIKVHEKNSDMSLFLNQIDIYIN